MCALSQLHLFHANSYSQLVERLHDQCSCLGAECFKQIQVLKFLWWGSVADHAADNSAVIEDVILKYFEELLQLDGEVSD